MDKKVIRIIAAVLIGITFECLANSVEAAITDVNFLPEEPTMNDVITISIYGVESRGAVLIDGSNFNKEGTSLQLYIFLNVGVFPVITPWSHSEDIGTLPTGLYDLTVRTFEIPNITDTYSMTFEVVPEPATLLFLCLGILGVRVG